MTADTIILADARIPAPPPLVADIDPWILLGMFAGIFATAIIWAVRLALKNRDLLPIACCAGALAAAFNEPIYDILGKIVYAENNPMAFSSFGREIPRGFSLSATFRGWAWLRTSSTR